MRKPKTKIKGRPTPKSVAVVVDWWQYERQALAAGHGRIAGIDEVGRGPLAGPVVAAAVVFPEIGLAACPAVQDSKQLTHAQREALDAELRQIPGIAIGIAVLSAAEVDRLNILRATHQAMRQAVAQVTADFALIDGLPVRGFPLPQQAIVKGDAASASIAAASIIAKVYRDRLMDALDAQYPGYGFAQHKGYGTEAHLEALTRLGPCPEHRRSFAPVAAFFAPPAPVQLELW